MFQKTTTMYLTPNHHQFNLIFKKFYAWNFFANKKHLKPHLKDEKKIIKILFLKKWNLGPRTSIP
jgi:hypothetical protein